MVTLRLTRDEAQQLLVWADVARKWARSTDLPFEPDEERIVDKIRRALGIVA